MHDDVNCMCEKFHMSKSSNVCDVIDFFFDFFSISSFFFSFFSRHYIIKVSRILNKSSICFFHASKRQFIIIFFFLLIEISYLKLLLNSSRHVVAIEYNLKSLLIELFRAMINTINVFTRFLELTIVAINWLRVRVLSAFNANVRLTM